MEGTSEIPWTQIGAGGALAIAILIIVFVFILKYRGSNPGSTQPIFKKLSANGMFIDHEKRISKTETEIVNMKEVFEEMKSENKEAHSDIITALRSLK